MFKILDYNKIYSHSVRRKKYLFSRCQRIWRLKKNWYAQVFEQNKKNDSPVYMILQWKKEYDKRCMELIYVSYFKKYFTEETATYLYYVYDNP